MHPTLLRFRQKNKNEENQKLLNVVVKQYKTLNRTNQFMKSITTDQVCWTIADLEGLPDNSNRYEIQENNKKSAINNDKSQ